MCGWLVRKTSAAEEWSPEEDYYAFFWPLVKVESYLHPTVIVSFLFHCWRKITSTRWSKNDIGSIQRDLYWGALKPSTWALRRARCLQVWRMARRRSDYLAQALYTLPNDGHSWDRGWLWADAVLRPLLGTTCEGWNEVYRAGESAAVLVLTRYSTSRPKLILSNSTYFALDRIAFDVNLIDVGSVLCGYFRRWW